MDEKELQEIERQLADAREEEVSSEQIRALIAEVRELRKALSDLVQRVDANGGLGEYKGGPAFALKNARDALPPTPPDNR